MPLIPFNFKLNRLQDPKELEEKINRKTIRNTIFGIIDKLFDNDDKKLIPEGCGSNKFNFFSKKQLFKVHSFLYITTDYVICLNLYNFERFV